MSYVVWVLCWVLLLSFKTSHYDSSHSSLVLVAIVSLILVVIVSLILVNIASLCSSQRCVRYSCLQDAKNLSKLVRGYV